MATPMFQSYEEAVQYAEFNPEDADYSVLEQATELDFIPDDPAELRCAVTDMAAHINLADWRFVKLVAAMDRRRGWDERGYCNLGNWLDHRCGLGPCAARERIRIGRALARLPRIDAAFRDGILSYSKVRAITRVATRDTEAMLLDIAGRSSAAQLESLVRTYERVDGSGGERVCSEARRSLSWHYEDGMLVVTAAVPAERGALLIKALQKVIDARKDEREAYFESLLAGEHGAAAVAVDGELVEQEPVANEETDGSGRLAAASDGQHRDGAVVVESVVTTDRPRDVSEETEFATGDVADDLPVEADDLPASLVFDLSNTKQRYADALVDVAEHYLANRAPAPGIDAPASATRWCSPSTATSSPSGRQEGGARYHVDPDWGIDDEDARQIACDADVTEFIGDARGQGC